MLVKDGAMKRGLLWGTAVKSGVCCAVNTNHVKDEDSKQPLGESLDGYERQVHEYNDQSGKPIPDEILAATVIAGIDNATVAQHLALNDGTLDTYPKIMDAVRSLVKASRGWNVSADGNLTDVDAMT